MQNDLCSLTTYGHDVPQDIPWNVHPRPQFRREKIFILNGIWDFEAAEKKDSSGLVPPAQYSSKIRVPFPVESSLSMIRRHFPEGTPLWYCRTLPPVIPENGERILLHLDAVDQEADIFLNQEHVAHIHTFEGYDGIDITAFLKEQNLLEICVTDDLRRKEFPYGKQTLKRGGMWYTPFSGIWQTVWLEIVPEKRIRSIKISPTLEAAAIQLDGIQSGTALFEGKEFPIRDGLVVLAPDAPVAWTPDHPRLYEFTLCCGKDVIHSYFALRTLSVKTINGTARLCLNEEPFFFHGLLDQGYWPDGLCTPPDDACYADDIMSMKELGFNTLRKHIKRESPRFYYECDRLGMIVFQDMINNGSYSFFKDTLLPTIGIKKLRDEKMAPHPESRKMFLDSMETTIRHLKNHPSVCCWTIFNEGWGQFESGKAYDRLKQLDASRFIDSASGWFCPAKSDLESLHVYFRKFRLPLSDKPVLLSEFGGYSFKLPDHCFNLSKTYGYRFYKDQEEFQQALEKLYRDEIIPAARNGLSGAVYTQVSDVEDETNGLLTYDRAVCKADKAKLREIAELLQCR